MKDMAYDGQTDGQHAPLPYAASCSMSDARLTAARDVNGYWRQADVGWTFVVKTDAENYQSSFSACQ